MFGISYDHAAVLGRMNNAPRQITQRVVKILERVGDGLQLAIVREKLAGQVLHRRTAGLSRAVYTRVWVDSAAAGGRDGDVVLLVGVDRHKAVYAAAQEYGATIRPTHGQFLTIPLTPALTANGVARVSAREFIRNPESLGFESSFVNQAKTAIMGVHGKGRGARVEPVFALKTQVTIPEHSFVRSTVRARKAWILEQLRDSTRVDDSGAP